MRFILPREYVLEWQVKTRLEEEVQRLSDFKAEFEHLAESSLHESDSEGCHAEAANPGEQDGKWKQRVKKIQKYAEWQLAEAHAQVTGGRRSASSPLSAEVCGMY